MGCTFFFLLLYAICMQVTYAKLPFQSSWQRIYHHSDSIFHRSWTLKGNLWKYSTSVRPALPRRTLSSLINMINFPLSQKLLVLQPLICSNFSCVSLAQVCLYWFSSADHFSSHTLSTHLAFLTQFVASGCVAGQSKLVSLWSQFVLFCFCIWTSQVSSSCEPGRQGQLLAEVFCKLLADFFT